MKIFEIVTPFGKEPRPDDIRYAANEVLRLPRGGGVVNVVDPTKSFQPTMLKAHATCRIALKSLDLRGDVKLRWQIEAYDHRDRDYKEYVLPEYQDVADAKPVIVIGAGPAGLFAALKLLMLGYKPVILERGKDVHRRKVDMARLSREGRVNPESNYCFGEGGAGAFSDGKLLTRSTKRGDIREVLYQFVKFGADPMILIESRPHIGTDKLPKVVEAMRHCIEERGGEYHFDSKVVDINKLENGEFEVKVEGLEEAYKAAAVILATGHSARDVYEMMDRKNCQLEAKGFAMGVRVEHPQSLINKMRYHGQWEPGMPAAEYSFVKQVTGKDDEIERGVFSFCMCPGGILVPSATEEGTTVLNGMSNSARNSKWANAGVVVSIEPGDEPQEYQKYGAFSLMNFQHDVEKAMFDYTAGKIAEQKEILAKEAEFEDEEAEYKETQREPINPAAAPAQRMIDFCNGVVSSNLPQSSYRPGVVPAPLHKLLPEHIAERLRKVFPEVNRTVMKGYFTNDALLLGVESRTSAAIKIVRDKETYQCVSMEGLFPAGEGAGYAGGIVSSAIDGINCAVAAVKYLNKE